MLDSWEELPDALGTINGSLAAEFDRFRRQLVTDFLSWQASIVREYARPDQFITYNHWSLLEEKPVYVSRGEAVSLDPWRLRIFEQEFA